MGESTYYYTEQGFELVLSTGPAHYPRHMHAQHWTVGLVRCGGVVLTTRQGTQRLTAGHCFSVPPLEAHSLRVEPRGALLVACVPEPEDPALPEALSDIPQDAPSPLTLAVRQLVRRMLHSPGDALPLQQMAALSGYSVWYFLRAFHKATGMTPHAFQLLCRLRLSRALLRTDAAAVEAAVSAGFADQSHMHKVFKRHHGMTPGAFRKASIRL